MTRDDYDEGRRRGRRGGWQVADLPSAHDAADWFRGRLPDDWFSDIEVRTDREEITVLGTLTEERAAGADGAEAEGRISRFRAETKAERIEIALEAQARYQRKVSWGVRLGDTEALFTHVAAQRSTAASSRRSATASCASSPSCSACCRARSARASSAGVLPVFVMPRG